MITIRKSREADLDRLMEIIEEARGTIAALGIEQWQNGYPSREIMEADVAEGASYLVTDGDGICGTFALFPGEEPTYRKIYRGSWLTQGDYVAIHRVAIAVKNRGRGIAEKIMEFSAEYAKKQGTKSLRIDTHPGNVVMRRMLEKNGFSYCGIIHLKNGNERVAYEKEL